MLEWIIPPEESGSKLISFLTKRLEGQYSARFLKRLIEHNGCEINDRTERFASTILGKGDHICLHLEQAALTPSCRVEPSRILFEDEDILVYNKPAGINSDEKGVLQLLRPSSPSLQLVHRLDRDTTGVLLLAKRHEVYENLVTQFKELQVRKRLSLR